jgi:hypothetical protein
LACLFFSLGWLLQGCEAEPDVIPLSIEMSDHDAYRELEEGRQTSIGNFIGVGEFTDSRRETAILGMKSGRWGPWDSYIFTVKGGDLGIATADALSRCLRTTGWQIRMIDETETTLPNVLVTGEIIEMQVNAFSNFFSTHLSASVILLVEKKEQTTGKRSSARLTGSRSRNVLWFHPQDAESLLNDALADAFHQWSPGMDGNEQMVGSRPED